MIITRVTLTAACLAICLGLSAQGRLPGNLFETAIWAVPENTLDKVALPLMEKAGFALRLCSSDTVFIRRVFLDLAGTLPTAAEVEAFTADRRADKRTRLVESLLLRTEYLEYETLKRSDLLRVKSEFPDNLWPNAVQAYNRWIYEAVSGNMPYDRFARALLLGGGSNFREPEANFYRAVESRTAASIAKAVALTWMAVDYDTLSPDIKTGFASFFSRVGYKKSLEWKEEIITLTAADKDVEARFPDGKAVTLARNKDPREVFADWLTARDNPWFARAEANRVWYRIMGNPLTGTPDNIGPAPETELSPLTDFLAAEFVRSGYDTRVLYRLILDSRVYQQSSLPQKGEKDPLGLPWSRYALRRLDAEVLIDALDRIGGTGEAYYSAIPEPFTFIPPVQRSIALADGSISSAFLMRFGRPSRDLGLASERGTKVDEEQLRYLLNSSEIRKKIEQSPGLREALALPGARKEDMIRSVYLQILSRPPTAEETRSVLALLASGKAAPRQAGIDLAWALINGKEFLYRH